MSVLLPDPVTGGSTAVPANAWTIMNRLFNNTQIYNVKHPTFGALGNGVADDGAAINACIAASTLGSTIIIPFATYLTSVPIIRKPFRRYMGWGPAWSDPSGAVIKVANGSSANFQSTSGQSGIFVPEGWNNSAAVPGGPVHIENLSLDGNKANNATGQHSGLLLYDEYWSTFNNVRSYNNKKSGVTMTRTAKNNVAQLTGISDIGFDNLHCSGNDGDGITQLSSGAGNNTDVMFTGRTVLYDNGGSGCTAENPGGWWLNNWHLWNNGVHGVYMDNGTHGVKINGLYVESFGINAVAAAQYFGLRLRTFNVTPATNTVPVMLDRVTVQTTDPAGTSSFYCISVVGDGTDAHAYLSNVHTLGANTARGHGIELFSIAGSNFTVHDRGSGATGFTAGQAREYNGSGTFAYDPPRIMAGTAAWTPGAIAANAGVTQSVTVTGAALGDRVALGYNQNLQDGLILTGEVSAANTVTAQIRNVTAGSLTPTAGTVNATVWKH